MAGKYGSIMSPPPLHIFPLNQLLGLTLGGKRAPPPGVLKTQQRRGCDYSNFTIGENFCLKKHYLLFGVISPCITLSCPFQKRPSSFLQFYQVGNIHGTYLKKNFLNCFSPLSQQAE